jgi:hypothetical protein
MMGRKIGPGRSGPPFTGIGNRSQYENKLVNSPFSIDHSVNYLIALYSEKMNVNTIYISTYRLDFQFAKFCIASIRYWYPDIRLN